MCTNEQMPGQARAAQSQGSRQRRGIVREKTRCRAFRQKASGRLRCEKPGVTQKPTGKRGERKKDRLSIRTKLVVRVDYSKGQGQKIRMGSQPSHAKASGKRSLWAGDACPRAPSQRAHKKASKRAK